jgi:hypothetical protein
MLADWAKKEGIKTKTGGGGDLEDDVDLDATE